MPRITADGQTFDATADTRLVNAIEDAGIGIAHRCGGYAACTTCRVSFNDGEPDTMTQAEHAKAGDEDFRLSCQILCDHDMDVDVLMKWEELGLDGAGNRPEDEVTPEAEFLPKADLG